MRHEVERRLGSTVQDFEERQGGFSFGVLGVATLSTGEQVFIKAIRDDAANVHDYRTETVVAGALPQTVPTPRLRFTCELAGWLLLCFDVVPGRCRMSRGGPMSCPPLWMRWPCALGS
jgi:hypothetical protein